MAFTHNLAINWSSGGRSVAANKNYTGESQLSISRSVADSSTDFRIIASIDQSQITLIIMKSDQDITVETNSGSAPTDTIALKAGVPYVWNADLNGYYANKITADVTDLYVTNASGAAALLELEVLTDATP